VVACGLHEDPHLIYSTVLAELRAKLTIKAKKWWRISLHGAYESGCPLFVSCKERYEHDTSAA
jgi:hypothetical protein